MSDSPFNWHAVTLILIATLGVGLTACNRDRLGKPLPGQAFQFPTGIAVRPDGFALVASSNYDLTYQSGSLQVIDLNALAGTFPKDVNAEYIYTVIPVDNEPIPEHTDIISDATKSVSLDNFAGRMTISEDNTLAAVTIRETNQLVLVDLPPVDTSGPPSALELNCFNTQPKASEKFPFCNGKQHVVTLDSGKDNPQIDPFDIVFVGDSAYVSFLQSNKVSIVNTTSLNVMTTNETDVNDAKIDELGFNDIAYSSKNNSIYVSSSGSTTTTVTNNIYYFATPAGGMTPIPLYSVLLGTETVGLELNKDESELAAVVLNPNMLLFLDTNNGNAYLGSVALGNNPRLVRRYPYGDGNLFFVPCAQEDTIYIIDDNTKKLFQVKDVHDVCNSPFDIGFFDRDSDSDHIHWALFTCFENDTVAVMDLDRTHASTYLNFIARVGKPRPK